MQSEMSSALLSAILDSADEAIITKSLEGVITSWNAVAESTYGYSAEEVLGKNITILIPENRLEEEFRILDKVRQGLRVERFETTRRRKDGNLIDVSLLVAPVKSPDGSVIGAVKLARDITAIRQPERVARERLRIETQFKLISESVPGIVCSFQMWPDGRACMPFATARIEDLYGIPASELAKDFSPVFLRVHPDDRAMMQDSVKQSYIHRTTWHCKFRYNHPTKGECWIEGWSSPQLDLGESTLWHGFLMDITESQQEKAARKASEILARSVLDSLKSHIAVVSEDGTILTVNKAWRDFGDASGLKGQLGEGGNYFDACYSATGEDLATATTVAQAIRDVAAGRIPAFVIEYPCYYGSARLWFRCRISPFIEDGPRHVVIAHYDITHLKMTEEQLRFRERMLAQSQAMAHVGSWELEVKHPFLENPKTLRWSDECMRIFGYEPGKVEVTDELFLNSLYPEDRPQIEEKILGLVADGTPYEVEHRIKRLDGVERIVQEWAELIRLPESDELRFVGTCQDVTERREAEDALKRSANLLETLWHQLLRAQEDERRRIARELHDEIGQALTAMMINLQQMKLAGDDGDERLRDCIDIVRQALEQVRGMALDLRPSILDDLGLVAALNWYVGRQAQRTGLNGRFVSEFDQLRAEPEMETTCFRIAQGALTNVARHARAKNFTVELLSHEDGFQLIIRDDGVGFDTEAAIQSVISGHSLGLAGMRERVEMIGGQIEFESKPGAGTEVRVTFKSFEFTDGMRAFGHPSQVVA